MTPHPPTGSTAWTLCGLLALGGVLGSAILAAVWLGDGSPSWQRAIAFSAIVSGTGAAAGWTVARWPKTTPGMAVAGGLAAVVLRLVLPLTALGWLQSNGGELQAVGADRLLLIFYLALLATDVVLHMMNALRTGR